MIMPEGQDATEPAESFATLSPATRRRLMAAAVLRAALTTTVLLTAYALLPFTVISQIRYLTAFLVGAAVVLVVLTAEFGRTMRSPSPRLRAIEALLGARLPLPDVDLWATVSHPVPGDQSSLRAGDQSYQASIHHR